MITYKFFDTCSLLLQANHLFEDDNENEKIVLSSITLQELEDIKTSNNKDAEIRYAARQLTRTLDECVGAYEVVIFTEDMLKPFEEKHLYINNDIKILACAFWYDTYKHPDETVFVTNDLCLKNIANLFFGEDSIESVKEESIDNYLGYRELQLNDKQLNDLYSNLNYNHFNLYINQYLIIKDQNDQTIDRRCWTGETHRVIHCHNPESMYFGEIKSKDDYQLLLIDSLNHNQINMVRGPAGSGKTLISLAYLFGKLERHEIDKIIVFCNTVATKDSARLGFYPGSRDEKLLDSQIGNLLMSKLGGMYAVEQLIQKEQLLLLPLSDIRGFDTSGMRAGIYISEAQNMNINLMKLALQRIGEDSICIIDGDDNTQVDDISFAGSNNGMKRASKIFRGQDFYGEVKLNNIYRSKIARIADLM